MGDPMLRLMELDARHTELLERLNVLDLEVSAVLNDWTKSKEKATDQNAPETVSEAETLSAA